IARNFRALSAGAQWHRACTRTAWGTSEAPGRPVMEKALAAWLLVAAATAGSATPTEVVQAAVTRAITIVQDADLGRPVNAAKRRSELRRAGEALFAFGVV